MTTVSNLGIGTSIVLGVLPISIFIVIAFVFLNKNNKDAKSNDTRRDDRYTSNTSN